MKEQKMAFSFMEGNEAIANVQRLGPSTPTPWWSPTASPAGPWMMRPEYGERSRTLAAQHTKFPEPLIIEKQFEPKENRRWKIVILGHAGMRIVTAGDIVCHAGIAAGFNATICGSKKARQSYVGPSTYEKWRESPCNKPHNPPT